MAVERAPLRVPVELRRRRREREDPAWWPRVWRLCEQVSTDQLDFEAALPFAPGERLDVVFVLPTEPPTPVKGEGVVRRAQGRPSEVGLISIEGTGRAALLAYIEEEGSRAEEP